MFIVKNNAAVGWYARGFDHGDAVKRVTIPLTADTLFRIVHGSRHATRGHVTPLAGHGAGARAARRRPAGRPGGAAHPARQGRGDPLLRHHAGRGAAGRGGRRRDPGLVRGQGHRRAERRAQDGGRRRGEHEPRDAPGRPRHPRRSRRRRRRALRPRRPRPPRGSRDDQPLDRRRPAAGARRARACARRRTRRRAPHRRRARAPAPRARLRRAARARRSRRRSRRRTTTPSASRAWW